MTADRPFFVTTPIYYVNDTPHLGHAYTTVACDVLARFMRLDGRRVKFLTGTDEHGQKVEQSARLAGLSPQQFTDRISEAFRDMTRLLDISNDDFIRTTEPRHIRGVQLLWQELERSGETLRHLPFPVDQLVRFERPTGGTKGRLGDKLRQQLLAGAIGVFRLGAGQLVGKGMELADLDARNPRKNAQN